MNLWQREREREWGITSGVAAVCGIAKSMDMEAMESRRESAYSSIDMGCPCSYSSQHQSTIKTHLETPKPLWEIGSNEAKTQASHTKPFKQASQTKTHIQKLTIWILDELDCASDVGISSSDEHHSF